MTFYREAQRSALPAAGLGAGQGLVLLATMTPSATRRMFPSCLNRVRVPPDLALGECSGGASVGGAGHWVEKGGSHSLKLCAVRHEKWFGRRSGPSSPESPWHPPSRNDIIIIPSPTETPLDPTFPTLFFSRACCACCLQRRQSLVRLTHCLCCPRFRPFLLPSPWGFGPGRATPRRPASPGHAHVPHTRSRTDSESISRKLINSGDISLR